MTTYLDYDYLLKLLIIGDSGVGKSALMVKFVDNLFVDSHVSTIGVDFNIKTIKINGKEAKLQIWDTAGQERFRTITNSYYKGAHGIVMVYDVTDRTTFNNLKIWINECKKYAQSDANIILIGNKTDIVPYRQVSTEEGKEFADVNNMIFIETSAKQGNNVEKAFVELAKNIILNKHENITAKNKIKPIDISGVSQLPKKKCCS
jgi:Ras-related protein Rab-1A